MIIAGAVVANGGSITRLLIENDVPVLRKKDIMKEEDADSPARRIYYIIQLMYLDRMNLTFYHVLYWKLARGFLSTVPCSLDVIEKINECILAGGFYRALKQARSLVHHEQNLLSKAQDRR